VDSAFLAVDEDVCRWIDVEGNLTEKIACEHLPPRPSTFGTETASVFGLFGKSDHELWAYAGAVGLLWRRQ